MLENLALNIQSKIFRSLSDSDFSKIPIVCKTLNTLIENNPHIFKTRCIAAKFLSKNFQVPNFNYRNFYIKKIKLRYLKIKCGDQFTLLSTQEGKLFSWGNKKEGQLGLMTQENILTPSPVPTLQDKKISDLTTSKNRAILLTDSGELYTLGKEPEYKTDGDILMTHQECPAPFPLMPKVVITSLACGKKFSLFLSNKQMVYSQGKNHFGQLGLQEVEFSKIMIRVPDLEKIESIATGYYHSLAVNIEGTAFSWGLNLYGQLGSGNETKRSEPKTIVFPKNKKVFRIYGGEFHTLAISSKGKPFTFGKGNLGQLGYQKEQQRTPQKVSKLSNHFIESGACGANHTLFLTCTGKVFECGNKLLNNFQTIKEIQINKPVLACSGGKDHSVVITEMLEIYCWGQGENGQLGNNRLKTSETPVLADFNPFKTSS